MSEAAAVSVADDRPRPHGLRFRALLVGLPLCVAMAFLTVYGDMMVKQVQIGILQLPPPALGGLFLLVLISYVLRKLFHRNVLDSRDLLPVYVMMTITVLMCSRGTIEKLIPPLIHANYAATPENQYMELFGPWLPKWLVAFDPDGLAQQDIAVDYSEGNAKVHWRLWIGPILSWCGLLSFVYLVFLCLSVILRRQWTDSEKLVFPLVTLPLALMDESTSTSFLTNKLTWIGVLIPVVVYSVNGLHANFAVVPEIKLSWTLNQYLTSRPWSGMYTLRLQFAFAAIGFFYFLSSDLLFSLWFFFLFTRLTDVIGTQMNYEITSMPQYPTRLYIGYQVVGAYTVLVIYLLRSGWDQYAPIIRHAFGVGKKPMRDGPDEEMLPYRLAVWGVLLGFLGAIVWCIQAGLDPWLAVVEIGIYIFIVALVLTRGVAEAGLLQTEASFRPVDVVKLVKPQYMLGAKNLTMLAMIDTVLTRDLRGVLLSNYLDDQKMAKELRFRPRSLLVPIGLAMLVAIVFGSYFFLTLSHSEGQVTLYTYPKGNAEGMLKEAATAIQQQIRTPWECLPAAIAGTGICTALVVLRTTVVWWPLHPLGYAVAGSWTMLVFWSSALITWLIKGAILRSGGMRLYRQAMPFFLGLVLGTFLMATAFTLLVFVGEMNNVSILAPSLGFD